MHLQTKRARRGGRLTAGLVLAAAVGASLSIGVPAASATCVNLPTTLTLTPATQTHATGQTASVTATAKCGTGPLTNRPVFFKVVSGPNTGKTFSVNSNASGVAVFNYTSALTGTDKVGAQINQTWKCCVDVVWTKPKPPIRYTGYAENASGSFTLPLLGTTTLSPVNPRGPVDTTATTDNTNTIVNLAGPVLSAQSLTAGVKTGSGKSTSLAKTVGASLALGTLPAISNIDVEADSSASCTTGLTGSTTITSLKIGTTVLVGPGGTLSTTPFVPTTNFTLNVGILKVVLNEHITSAGTITVNAIHVTVPAVLAPPLTTALDLTISTAKSDIHDC